MSSLNLGSQVLAVTRSANSPLAEKEIKRVGNIKKFVKNHDPEINQQSM